MRGFVPNLRTARWLSQELRSPSTRRKFLSSKSRIPGATAGQAIPLGPYYEAILKTPPPYHDKKPEEPPTSSNPKLDEPAKPAAEKPKSRGRKPKEEKSLAPSNSDRRSNATESAFAAPRPSIETSPPTPTPPPSSAQAQARVIFGSRLLGPAERAERWAEMQSRSTLVAGVRVPPRPDEPDNCCMSGCVNCVWDRYRDEIEDWASAHAEAEQRLRAQEAGATGTATAPPPVGTGRSRPSDLSSVTSMDAHGGGSETNWGFQARESKSTKDFWDEELSKDVPVGIREFMKHEKKLKLKHEREGTVGG